MMMEVMIIVMLTDYGGGGHDGHDGHDNDDGGHDHSNTD